MGPSDFHSKGKTEQSNRAEVVGPSQHRTFFDNLPPVSRRFGEYSVSNLTCFPGQESLQKFQLWTTGSERVRGSGTQLMSICREQSGGTRARAAPEGQIPQFTRV